jgi:hypothetical protein
MFTSEQNPAFRRNERIVQLSLVTRIIEGIGT